MIQIVSCKDCFEELVHFVSRLNSDGTHHIGFFGEGEADVRASLAECLIPPAEGFFLAYDNGQLVGVFGVDADPEVGHAWLFGPLVEHADWHTIADKLYAEVAPRIPAGVQRHTLFCDAQNIHMAEFAARHGFPFHSETAVLTLERSAYRPSAKRETKVIAYEEDFFEALEKLHDTLFPNTYLTARQMVERINATHQLLFAVNESRLLGYYFGKIEPDAELGYVDFIGTDASARGRGVGADLLAAGLDWMLSAPTTRRINLTVIADNVAARGLYEKFGFVIERVMRGYRKQVT